jgi:GTP cyclohydrolase II
MRTEKLVEAHRRVRAADHARDVFRDRVRNAIDDNVAHVAMVMGDIGDGKDILVRVHSECLTGRRAALDSLRLRRATRRCAGLIAREGRGVFLYLHQEGRGIGLANKLRAYELQDRGADTVEANLALGLPADKRDYGLGSQMLADLGVKEMRLITNNPKKIVGLEGYGLTIVGRVALQTAPTPHNSRYMETKREARPHARWRRTDRGGVVKPNGASDRQRCRAARANAWRSSSARFYADLADWLEDGARRALDDCGVAPEARVFTASRLLRAAARVPPDRYRAASTPSWRSASSSAARRRTSTTSPASARAASWTCSSRPACRSASASSRRIRRRRPRSAPTPQRGDKGYDAAVAARCRSNRAAIGRCIAERATARSRPKLPALN